MSSGTSAIVFGLFLLLLLGPTLWVPSLLQWRIRTQSGRISSLAVLIGESGARWFYVGLGAFVSLVGIAYIGSGMTSIIRSAKSSPRVGDASSQVDPQPVTPEIPATRSFSDVDGAVRGLAFSPKGTTIMTAGHSFQLWNLDTGESQPGLDARDRGVRLVQQLTSSASLRFVAVAFGNGTITIERGAVGRIDWEDPLQCEIHHVPYSPHSVAISADGRYALATPQYHQGRSNFPGFHLIDYELGEVHAITDPDQVLHVRFIGDTYQAAIARTQGRFAIYDVTTRTLTKEIEPPDRRWTGECRALEVAPNGEFAITCYVNKGDDNHRLWDVRRGTYVERERDEGTGGHIVFLPDDRRVAIGRFMQPTVDIYERATGKRIRSLSDRFEGEHFGVYALGISPDGGTIAAATNNRLMFWDVLGDE